MPDAGIDAWKTVWAFAGAATEHGARILPYHRVTEILRDGDSVAGARLRDERGGEDVTVEAGFTLNASGAWAGQIAALAGIEGVEILPGKGIMIAMNHRLVNTVINRCTMPADGDILVPIRTVSVIGTTDIRVRDPDEPAITQDEVEQMFDDGETLVPGFRQARALRVWAGVRPLFQDTKAGSDDSRDVTRAHTMLDHRERDGIARFLTITGGKLTTMRLMAKDTVDAMCAQLGEDRPCRTAEVVLPGSEDGEPYHIGARLAAKERHLLDDQLVCECELIPRARLEETMRRRDTTNLDDIRRSLRLGMGPCQGGFCIYRATGILHDVEQLDGAAGQRLADRLPAGALEGRLAGALRRPAAPGAAGRLDLPGPARRGAPARVMSRTSPGWAAPSYDALVIGAGLAGLSAAVRLAEGGARVIVLAKGVGATHLAPGTIDVLGYAPERVQDPGDALGAWPTTTPTGGSDATRWPLPSCGSRASSRTARWPATATAATWPRTSCCPRPWARPSRRPSCPRRWRPATCATTRRCSWSASARCATSSRPTWPTTSRAAACPPAGSCSTAAWTAAPRPTASGWPGSSSAPTRARRSPPRSAARSTARRASASPPASASRTRTAVWSDLQERLGRPVFEIATLPPSVPGMRVFRTLRDRLRALGGRMIINSPVVGAQRDGDGRWSRSGPRRPAAR